MSDLIRCDRCRCLTSPRLRPNGCRLCMLEGHGHISLSDRDVRPDVFRMRWGPSGVSRWLPRGAFEAWRIGRDGDDDKADERALRQWLRCRSLYGHINGIPTVDDAFTAPDAGFVVWGHR